jgi:RNA polymerase sigma-70 factor, Bacteroides expansion family 1
MDELSLLFQLRDGNENSFKELFVKFYSPLCEYASHYIRTDEAEELVQDLMMYIWEERENLVIERSIKSYLFSATRNRCLNAIKKNIYHEQVHSLMYEKLKEQFENPDYYFVDELAKNIEKAINELPPTYKEVFSLSRFGEQTNVQIAKTLGVSVKTVEYRITQSLKILRVKLKDYLSFVTFLF